MKKIIIFLAFLACFGLSGKAMATSGACSWHGGVNCSAGQDWDGSAICNDGWKDSTVLFSQVIECQDNQFKPLCTASESAQFDIKHGVPDLQKQYDDLSAQVKTMTDQYNALPDAIIGADAQAKSSKGAALMVLLAKQSGIQAQLKLALDQSLTECRALGSIEYQQKLQQALKEIDDLKQRSLAEPQKTIPQPQCPSNSTLGSDGSCICNTGFAKSQFGNGCISLASWCQEINSTFDDTTKQCTCLFGFSPNPEKTRCLKNVDEITVKSASPKNSVNVRAKATANSKIIGIAKKNVKYEISDNTNKFWVKIKLNPGVTGWVSRALVKVN